MKKAGPKRVLAIVAILALTASLLTVMAAPALAEDGVAKLAAKGEVQAARIHTSGGDRVLPSLSGGVVDAARVALANQEASPQAQAAAQTGSGLGITVHTLGCSDRDPGGNVRVNQDCTFRRQAEESIAVNPADPQNLVAGQNDSRIGFNHCGFDYSFNGGQTWGDGLPPFWQHLNSPTAGHTILGGPGTLHTYDAASDPGVAVDSAGRAFFSCVVFDINTVASGFLVSQSPLGAGGSFYNNVPAAGSTYVVVEDNNPAVFHDKPFIATDFFTSSPNRDNVYAVWTVFRMSTTCGAPPNGTLQYCSSPIFGSMSTDHAVTWSTPEEISGSSSLCFLGNLFDPSRPANACDFDQGADPKSLPNGDLDVIFNNGNTPPSNPNAQQLGVRCHPSGSSTAGTAHLNCASPAKVGNDVSLGEPLCDFGRGPEECIPGAYIRTNDFPRLAVNRTTGMLVATWQDYRNSEFDVQLSESTDGGKTWHEAAQSVNPDNGINHYMPAIDVASGRADTDVGDRNGGGEGENGRGGRVAVSYYRTPQVPNEAALALTTVFAPGQPGVQAEPSNYYLAGGSNLSTPYHQRRVSPDFPPPDGIQAGFNGDYSGLVVIGQTAHPIWSDTRNPAPAGQGVAHDEDIFTDAVGIP